MLTKGTPMSHTIHSQERGINVINNNGLYYIKCSMFFWLWKGKEATTSCRIELQISMWLAYHFFCPHSDIKCSILLVSLVTFKVGAT